LHALSAEHWLLIVLVGVTESHVAPAARFVLRQLSHESPVLLTLPVWQYSVAHLVLHGPEAPHTQAWM
jgi:hypothetical protein